MSGRPDGTISRIHQTRDDLLNRQVVGPAGWLHQFFDDLAVVDEVLWAAVGVGQGDGVWVDSELVVDRGEDLLDVDWSVLSDFTEAVGGSDELAVLHAAASQEERRGAGPVISAGVSVDPRSSSELSGHHDDRVVESTSDFQVFNQGTQRSIEVRQFGGQRLEIIAVKVPAADGEGDATGSGFDQPTRQDELGSVAVGRHSVSLKTSGVFLVGVQCSRDVAGSDQRDGSFGEAVQRVHHAGTVDVPPQRVETAEQFLSVTKSRSGDVAVQGEVCFAGAVWSVASEDLPEEARSRATGKVDESRSRAGLCFLSGAEHLRHDRADAGAATERFQRLQRPAGVGLRV